MTMCIARKSRSQWLKRYWWNKPALRVICDIFIRHNSAINWFIYNIDIKTFNTKLKGDNWSVKLGKLLEGFSSPKFESGEVHTLTTGIIEQTELNWGNIQVQRPPVLKMAGNKVITLFNVITRVRNYMYLHMSFKVKIWCFNTIKTTFYLLNPKYLI